MIPNQIPSIFIILCLFFFFVRFSTAAQYFPDNDTCVLLNLKSGISQIPITAKGFPSRDYYSNVSVNDVSHFKFQHGESLKCILYFCGFNLGKEDNSWDWKCVHSFKNGNALVENFNGTLDVFTATSCSCVKNVSPTCNTANCFSKPVDWKVNECARLYRESRCISCYYTPLPLKVGETISVEPFVVKSLHVRPGYLGKVEIGEGKENVFTWEEHSLTLMHIYTRNETNYRFSCELKPGFEGESIQSNFTDRASSGSIAIWVGGAGLILVAVVAISFVLIRGRRQRKREGRNSAIIVAKKEIIDDMKNLIELENRSLRNKNKLKTKSPLPKFDTTVFKKYDENCEIPRRDFELEGVLGKGHFGKVYKGELRRGGDEAAVAVKTIKEDSVKENVIQSFLREVELLYSLGGHENIVGFLGACSESLEQGQVYILLELCEKGALISYLRKEVRQRTAKVTVSDCDGYTEEISKLESDDFKKLMEWSAQIANGMEFLHAKKIIHVDLAARNILLTGDLRAKISDFGLSRRFMTDKEYVDSMLAGVIPPNSMAPEHISKGERKDMVRVSLYTDVWGYGCLLWEIFSLGEQPYYGLGVAEICDMIRKQERLEIPKFAPEQIYSKMKECWNEVPDNRPLFPELKAFFLEEISKDLNHQ